MSCTNKICWYRVFINGLIHVLYLVKPCENTLTKVSANLHCWEHSSAVSICKRDVNVIYDHDVGTCWNACNSGLGVLWTSCWMVLAAALKVGWPVFQTSLSTIWLRKCRRVSSTKGMQRSCWFGPELNPTNHGALHTPDCRSASIFKKTGIAQSSPKLAGFQVRNTALCLRSLSNFHVLRKRPQAFVETSWKSHAFRKAATSVGPSALCEQCPFPQPSNSPNLQQEWRGTRIQTVEWDGPINHEILSDLIPILWYLLWFSSNKTGDTGCTFYLAQASTGLHSLALQQVADIMTGWSACQTLRRACRTGHCFVSSGLGTQRKSPNKKQILHTEWLYIYIYIKAPDFAVACCKALRRPSSCWYCSYRTTAMVRKHHQRLKFELVLGAVTERF